MGDCSRFPDSRFYIETGTGKLQARWEAQTLYFEHEKRGVLFYIRNKDTNRDSRFLSDCIWMRRTRIMCLSIHLLSSDKYPNKDIFFDLCSKTYHTFVNAFTYIPFTAYPVCSQSEEQLLKMADVYLSCMKAPGIRRNAAFLTVKRSAMSCATAKARLRWQERCTARISAC